jgi:hypothetical protein
MKIITLEVSRKNVSKALFFKSLSLMRWRYNHGVEGE